MKAKKNTVMILLIFLFSIVLSQSLVNNTLPVSAYKGNRPVIIIDAGHDQRFNHTHLQSAIDILEAEEVDGGFEAIVRINTDPFTLTNIRGADLLIIPAPFIDALVGSFGGIENLAITEFYEDGGSVLYLANPYFFEEEYRNYSSNMNYVNNMMGTGEETYGDLIFNNAHVTLMNDFENRYNDERFIYLNNQTFDNTHPIIEGIPNDITDEYDPINELLIHSNYLSTSITIDNVINTPMTTYYVDDDGVVPFGGTQNYTVLKAEEKTSRHSRGISCASGVMFSDIQIVENDTTTWYEAYDNALLWKNMIAWLLHDIPVDPPTVDLPPIGIFIISIIAIFFVLMVIGSLLFTIGRESKKVDVSEAILKIREREDRKKKIDKEIEEAYYTEAPDDVKEATVVVEEEEEEKEIDMKSISDEVKKKPPKTRSRSERRRQS